MQKHLTLHDCIFFCPLAAMEYPEHKLGEAQQTSSVGAMWVMSRHLLASGEQSPFAHECLQETPCLLAREPASGASTGT